MELRQLRYLLAVAAAGNFTRAAETVFVTQSALSQQIQALEQEMGAVLLDRSRRGVRLTAAGEILHQHAQRIMLELEGARVAIEELAGLQRGDLCVGVVQTVNAYLLPMVVTMFAADYPQIKLSIEELPSDDIEAGLTNGDLQVGISFTPPTNTAISTEDLFTEQLVLVVRDDHALAHTQAVPVQALDGMALVMLSKTFCTRRLWEENARLAAAQPQVVLEMNTVSSILSVVARTGLPTVLPAPTLQEVSPQNLVGVRLQQPELSRTVGLLWHQDNYLCTASRAFMEVTRQVADQFIAPEAAT